MDYTVWDSTGAKKKNVCCIFHFECGINCHPLSGGSAFIIPTHQSKKLQDQERKISSERLSLQVGCYTVLGTVSLLIWWMFVPEHSFILQPAKPALPFSFLRILFVYLFPNYGSLKGAVCASNSSHCVIRVCHPALKNLIFSGQLFSGTQGQSLSVS